MFRHRIDCPQLTKLIGDVVDCTEIDVAFHADQFQLRTLRQRRSYRIVHDKRPLRNLIAMARNVKTHHAHARTRSAVQVVQQGQYRTEQYRKLHDHGERERISVGRTGNDVPTRPEQRHHGAGNDRGAETVLGRQAGKQAKARACGRTSNAQRIPVVRSTRREVRSTRRTQGPNIGVARSIIAMSILVRRSLSIVSKDGPERQPRISRQ